MSLATKAMRTEVNHQKTDFEPNISTSSPGKPFVWTTFTGLLRVVLLLIVLLSYQSSFAEARFPKPEFESGHVPPETQTVAPRAAKWEYVDVAVLFVLLCVMSWFVLGKRSRKGIVWTAVASVLYFGVYRLGCVCSVGSIQNISMSLSQADYIIPLSVIAFFVLPLLFTLFFGRTFCAGVCFMGAIQELVHIKTVKLPLWLTKPLSFLPYIYLGLAVLLAATGADFIICRYDPFIGFFRMSAGFGMVIFGVIIVMLSMFIGRPYCRFLCPYGVLLGWMSTLSFRHTTISPSSCVQCKLCEDSCPVNAIAKPLPVKTEKPNQGRRRLIFMLLLLPVLVISAAWLGRSISGTLSGIHPTVSLAQEIKWENDQGRKTNSEESQAFHSSGIPAEQLFQDAGEIQRQFRLGSSLTGAFLGLVLALALLKTAVLKKQKNYEPDKANCVSCGRCYRYCPVGKANSVSL
mgnify:FL=1